MSNVSSNEVTSSTSDATVSGDELRNVLAAKTRELERVRAQNSARVQRMIALQKTAEMWKNRCHQAARDLEVAEADLNEAQERLVGFPA